MRSLGIIDFDGRGLPSLGRSFDSYTIYIYDHRCPLHLRVVQEGKIDAVWDVHVFSHPISELLKSVDGPVLIFCSIDWPDAISAVADLAPFDLEGRKPKVYLVTNEKIEFGEYSAIQFSTISESDLAKCIEVQHEDCSVSG